MLNISHHDIDYPDFAWGHTVDNISVDAKSPTSSVYIVSYTTSEDNHCDTWFTEWPNFDSAIAYAESLKAFLPN